MNPKNCYTILHSQFNYHTLPVTLYKRINPYVTFGNKNKNNLKNVYSTV